MNWLEYAETAQPTENSLSAANKEGGSFTIEWKRVDILSPDLSSFKKNLSDHAADQIARSELVFLKANPEAASNELFLRDCEPLLKNDFENVDWNAIHETIKTSIKNFYLADLSAFGPDLIKPLLNDIYFCATLRKQNGKDPLGFLLFSITPALPYGDVKVINFLIADESQSLELPKTLMGVIFKILPQTKRLFLFSRPTDSAKLETYASMGFEKDENPYQDPNHKINSQCFVSLDYRIENSNVLQQSAEEMEFAIGTTL